MAIPDALVFGKDDLVFSLHRRAKIDDLMNAIEDRFFDYADAQGLSIELIANVIWNTKDAKKALNPNDLVGSCFQSGDTCGVHGDVESADTPHELPEESKIPITILTGFLGAGKTTLLNYILEQQKGKKIAVIENEFGEVAIDDALLTQNKIATAETVTVLNNGCMCCTVRDDLEGALRNILEACTDRASIDSIIIETTGMADPVPIVRTIKSIPQVTAAFVLMAGIVALADAKHLPGLLSEKVETGKVNEAYQQIAFADRVLLNKMDLVSADDVIAVKEKIRSINRFAKLIPSFHGRINLGEIMNLNAYSLMHFRNEDFEAQDQDDIPAAPSRPRQGSMNLMSMAFTGQSNTKSRHSSKVGSFSIIQEGEIPQQLLSRFLQMLQQPDPGKGKLFRFKAILAVSNSSKKVAVHAVQDVVDTCTVGDWQDGEPRICKLVFIGKDLDRSYFQGVFEEATNWTDVRKGEACSFS
eukprot:CAMPEP_0197705882 /NCGR_PEP_ID=MMETSP1338-20131121/126668_1 /TAXON_ID=43686 ORGANISM="Pelagodinium beii, Strain RCC1491" /NCGR_SAMPLE_ID=MMETSP1338 /ASSEMBLY_ACC=CAM_ASM_000754 /LENGTH=470 /DNA_ID=CAMNT_0043289791 /DNA_START=153 /DNA_END=1562 /DNA_ORIENTATION=-